MRSASAWGPSRRTRPEPERGAPRYWSRPQRPYPRPNPMKQRFDEALPFRDYLDGVEKNQSLWRGVYERAVVPDDATASVERLPGTWHLLALSEDWCGDAANILPVVARLAESASNLDLRILSRDENPDLMDAHLTDGRSRSIPVVMILDDQFNERSWWGPRPSDLQRWVVTEGMSMESGPRYRHTRTFYARDRGRSILREVIRELTASALRGKVEAG